MSEQIPKDQKLDLLKKTGLIGDEINFDNLSHPQIDFLLKKVEELKRPELTEEEIDRLKESELLGDVVKKQLDTEVVKRRLAQQELINLKSKVKSKFEEIASLFK